MATEPGLWSVPARRRSRRVSADVGGFLRHLDYLLLAAVAGLLAYGLWIVRAVTANDVPDDPGRFLLRQAIYVGAGAAALAATTAIDPDLYRRHRHLLLGVGLALMVVVFLVGPSVRGSRRWLDLGSFQL